MSLTDAEKNRLKKVGLQGLNKPKRTPSHPTKKGVVAVRDAGKMKIIPVTRRWVTTIQRKLVKASRPVTLRISRRARHQPHTGRIRCLVWQGSSKKSPLSRRSRIWQKLMPISRAQQKQQINKPKAKSARLRRIGGSRWLLAAFTSILTSDSMESL